MFNSSRPSRPLKETKRGMAGTGGQTTVVAAVEPPSTGDGLKKGLSFQQSPQLLFFFRHPGMQYDSCVAVATGGRLEVPTVFMTHRPIGEVTPFPWASCPTPVARSPMARGSERERNSTREQQPSLFKSTGDNLQRSSFD